MYRSDFSAEINPLPTAITETILLRVNFTSAKIERKRLAAKLGVSITVKNIGAVWQTGIKCDK